MPDLTRQEQLFEFLEDGNFDRVRSMLEAFHPSEIADLLESLPGRHRKTLWDLVNPEVEGDVLSEVQDVVRAGLLEQMQPQEVAEVTQGLDTDDAADILQDLPEERVDSVLLSMDTQNRQRIASLLSYPEDTAGGLMDTDVVWVRADVSLDVVVRYLRQLGELPDHTDSLIVLDRETRYLGVLPLADVLVNKSEDSVGEHMSEEVGIPADMPAEDVARLFEQRDLISAAVLDENGKLLGRITVDDVLDVIQEQAEQTMRNMAGPGRRRPVCLGPAQRPPPRCLVGHQPAQRVSRCLGDRPFRGHHPRAGGAGDTHAHRCRHGRQRRQPGADRLGARPGAGPDFQAERPITDCQGMRSRIIQRRAMGIGGRIGRHLLVQQPGPGADHSAGDDHQPDLRGAGRLDDSAGAEKIRGRPGHRRRGDADYRYRCGRFHDLPGPGHHLSVTINPHDQDRPHCAPNNPGEPE